MPLESFTDAMHKLRKAILNGIMLDRGEWQGQTDKPMSRVLETYDVTFQTPIPKMTTSWQAETMPNLPWAEDHFQERVGGVPLNPGKEYKNWPWYEQGVEEHKDTGKFSHTYMERFWPGGAFGNLGDVVKMLHSRPWTRQAYLTVWWPHDALKSLEGERVPCTLGYHFQRRPHPDVDSLDITYYMRSCDFFRYLRDDAYMAGRLLQWVVDQVDDGTGRLETGHLTMHIANLHIFADERIRLEQEWTAETARRMSGAF